MTDDKQTDLNDPVRRNLFLLRVRAARELNQTMEGIRVLKDLDKAIKETS